MAKICMIVHKPYFHDTRVRRYAEALVDAGAQVDILCLHSLAKPSNSNHGAVRVFTIPFSRGAGRHRSYLLEYGVAFVLYTVWLLVLYMKNRYPVIHVHNMPDFLVFTAVIPWLFGAKVILDIHDPMPEFYMSKHTCQTESTMVWFMRVQEKLSARLAHAVITANPNFKVNLVKRGIPADKITVVNNIADPRLFNRDRYALERRKRSDRFTLIYPGTIAPRYGLPVAIRALPLLIPKIPNICLRIIGSGEKHVGELAALAEQRGVSCFVEFKPLIPPEEVARQMILADVGIYPALPDAHMSIATPSKVLEYATMGIPILASRLEILEALFGDSAIMFFEPGDVNQFAHCVLELYEHPERRDELVRNADNVFVHTHAWVSEQQAYFDLLNRLPTQKDGMIVQDEGK